MQKQLRRRVVELLRSHRFYKRQLIGYGAQVRQVLR